MLKFALLLLLAAPTTLSAQTQVYVLARANASSPVAVVRTGTAYVQVLQEAENTTAQEQTEPGQNQPAAEAEPGCSSAFASEVTKTIERNYKVGNSDRLNIENKFGKVHVNTWKKNEIHVKVDIICRAGTDQRAQQLMDLIRVTENRSGKVISFRTELEPIRINNNSEKGFEINYTVSMPDDNPLTVKNSFGDVYLANFRGVAAINVRYGSLKAEQLNNTSNTVKVAYGSANCRYINQGNIDLSYGSLNVEGTNGLQGSSKFSDIKIGSLNSSLDLDMKYGALRIDNISRNASKINVAGGFSPISLRFEDKTTFKFDVNVQFGNFKYDKELVTLTSHEKSHTSTAYKGSFGSAAPKGSVSIVSKYGDVKFSR
ncbi:DUF4097 family beta strand repeat-containing protein [Botryobacter ruber]|uniref:DUF4097 family beta strand repeat-containing protein n=1 Tax=Botryobacter ruber TaxID=2171629 RepID=UPI000E0AE28A|nr:DUF4097 family beta strand repeat-containing protein [Botryobacter ruber]